MKNQSLIAVVALSGVFPGATGKDRFWDNTVNKIDATDEVPPHRWTDSLDWIYDRTPAADKAYAKRACLIGEAQLDGLNRQYKEIASPEPLYQWVLHATDDALKQCNTESIDKGRIGSILAAIALPTRTASNLARRIMDVQLQRTLALYNPPVPDPLSVRTGAGRIVSKAAALVCSTFGLGGPAFTLDAACASSLYALKLACDELSAHRCDAMVTGGVSGADCLYTQIGFSQLRALSPSGRCAPFDRSADGLVVGEGAGILVLKRLEDAVRDQDTIYGVIRGIGLSNDMRGNLLAPESDGQLRAMRAAYAQAGWRPWDVDYVECHGAGTPVGDATELKSLAALWKDAPARPHPCAIGSVKSMIGHLLTAAGAAGMIKTLLGLHHRILPPSLKFEQAAPGSPLIDSPFAVQKEARPWNPVRADEPRRAAVSAFGFGGINGHVLIQEWRPDDHPSKKNRRGPKEAAQTTSNQSIAAAAASDERAIAIVGMDTCIGALSSLSAFQEAVFTARPALTAVPQARWKAPEAMRRIFGDAAMPGAFLKEVAVELGEFQIPPGEIPDILPQQLLMLKVAAGALRDAGLPLREPRERMGATIGIGFDYEATNFHLRWILPQLGREWRSKIDVPVDEIRMDEWLRQVKESCSPPLTATRTLGALGGIVASRLAREFRFGAPSFVVSAEEASGLRALEIAMRLLQAHLTDAMLVGAVDLTGDERNLATLFDHSEISPSGRVRPFDQTADGTLPGEGAVALVLKRLADARATGDRIYAVIKGIGSAHSGRAESSCPSPAAYRDSLARALADAGTTAAAVRLVETHGSGIADEDDVETEALHTFFSTSADDGSTTRIALGALKPLTGHTGAAAGLVSLAKTALCLRHHLLPAMPHFESPRRPDWRNGPFHFPLQTAYWSADREAETRTAVVAAMTRDGSCVHAVLEPPGRSPSRQAAKDRCRRPMGPLPYALFIIKGQDRDDLAKNIDRLGQLAREAERDALGPAASMETLGHRWYRDQADRDQGTRVVSIVAHSLDDLQAQLSDARHAIRDDRARSMTARGGVCHLPGINGAKGEMAFVFPGSGNHYVGMGRTLGAHWPEILRSMNRHTARLRSQMLPHLYDPWRTDWRQGWQTESYRQLVADPLNTIFGQVVFGGQVGRLLQAFDLRPDAVIGYSLGESAGLFALGAWPDHGQMLERLAGSDLFKTQLCGSCRALRKAWRLADDQIIQWCAAVVNKPAEQVDRAISGAEHVRRLIINTPNECVIGGLKEPVLQVIDRLGCEALFLDGVVTVHCDAARPVAAAYKELHRFPTQAVEGVRFYSCARGGAYEVSSEATADSILNQALHGFDFPRTIRQAYADGVRLFVEVGPQASCTRMIRQILKNRTDCLAVAANMRGEDECLTLLKCLGTIAAAGQEVDLAMLYGYGDDRFRTGRPHSPNVIRVRVGGAPLSVPPLPARRPAQPKKPAAAAPAAPTPVEQPPVIQVPVMPASPNDPAGPLPAFSGLLDALNANAAETARAHDRFLDLARDMTRGFGEAFELQNRLIGRLAGAADGPPAEHDPAAAAAPAPARPPSSVPVLFTREQCLEFAVGSVGKVLGPSFDVVDTYKCRVRLPDEPLMLVDRILHLEGRMGAMGSGRLITEHDVLSGAWYLDGGRAPVCIAVEAGQADLFLSSYLGIDHRVKGERAYRLLDAEIHFHRGLPRAGETVRYDIHIDKFVRQGPTYLFFFRFEGYIGDAHLITMTNGCAGFFTEQEVRDSGGIILTDADRAPGTAIAAEPFKPLVPLNAATFGDAKIEALRRGDAGQCFGTEFKGVQLPPPLRLPDGRMHLIDRIVTLDPAGGRWGLGYIKAEVDIHPDDWFLTCHFVDDMVMPGTLMYECCAHTLRVLLLGLGWVTGGDGVGYEPVPGIACRLKCRGPVTPQTRHVHYAVEIKAIGYRPEPFVLADAHMYADGQYIVFFKDMSMQMSGVGRDRIEDFWERRKMVPAEAAAMAGPAAPQSPGTAKPVFTREQVLEFAMGRPSKAFGDPYAPFDEQRRIARLPAPPYSFIDRVTKVEPKPWVLQADGWIEARYDLPADAWYFAADRSGTMPLCVLMEIALQPCGWLAAYAGSALRSEKDLRFRNLGGQATLHDNPMPGDRPLTMRTRMLKVSEAVDMIIENFEFEVHGEHGPVYTGTTYFGFFTDQALARQVGMREGTPQPEDTGASEGQPVALPHEPPFEPNDAPAGRIYHPQGLRLPARALSMLDRIERFDVQGGPHGLGYVRGHKQVNPSEWYFKAHFYQDPVCPGSLGIESFLQLLKYAALQRWPECTDTHRYELLCGQSHGWQYRGQVVPSNRTVTVEAMVTRVEDGAEPAMTADGWLQVDGLYIYKMTGFGIRLVPLK